MQRDKFEEILKEYRMPKDLIRKLWINIGRMTMDEHVVRAACEECRDAIEILNLRQIVQVKFDYSKINYN